MKKIDLLREFISQVMPERKLTTRSRNALPDEDFVFPGDRSYPIQDKSHARNALSRVSQHGPASKKRAVKAAVRRKYPDIKQSATG